MPRCLETIHSTARQLICSPLTSAHSGPLYSTHCIVGGLPAPLTVLPWRGPWCLQELTPSLASRHFVDKFHCSKSISISLSPTHSLFFLSLTPFVFDLGAPLSLFNELREKTKTRRKLMSTGFCFQLCKKNPEQRNANWPAELRLRVQLKDRTCK